MIKILIKILKILITEEWGGDEAMAALRSLTSPPLTPHNPNSASNVYAIQYMIHYTIDIIHRHNI